MGNSLRRRRRAAYRARRRQRRRAPYLWAGAASCAALIAVGLTLGPFSVLRADVTASDSCVLVLVADRTGSSDDEALAEMRAAEAHMVLQRRSECGLVVVSEIKERFGQARISVVPLSSDSSIWVERKEQEERGLDAAHEEIDEIFLGEAGGRTNFLATLYELQGQVNAFSDEAPVHLYAWWDGIESVAPFNMRRELQGEAGTATKLLGRLDRIPDCTGWSMNFVGVNQNVAGGTSSELALGAEQFWREFVNLCGGTMKSYSRTLPTFP